MRCCGHTQIRIERSVMNRGGGPCSRPAKYIDSEGRGYCAQHAKEPATVMRKATGKLRDGLMLIEQHRAES